MLQFKEKYGFKQEDAFIIGRTLDKNVIAETENNDVTLTLIEYKTEWMPSQPENNINKSIPNKTLKSEQNASYSVEIPYKSYSTPTTYEEDNDENIENKEPIQPDPIIQHDYTQARFEVVNKSSNTIRVRLTFNKTSELNYWCPSSAITVEVLPQHNKEIIVLSKIIPNLSWPDIDYKWEVIHEENERITEEQFDNNAQQYSDDVAVNVSDDDIRGSSEQINCPKCTSFNDANAKKCEICEHELKGDL